jgi:5'(3')-deoxyribonucleotidase
MTTIPRPTINVDLDGVVYPFNLSLARFLEFQGRVGPLGENPEEGVGFHTQGVVKPHALKTELRSYPVPTTWNFWSEWNMSRGDWMMAFRRGVEYNHIWKEEEPIEGAVSALWELSDSEYYIRLVTHRLNHPFGHQQALASTAEWLNRYAIPYRSIAFLGDESKSSYRAPVLIDDAPHNCIAFADKAGSAILFDQPWNQEVEEHARLTRAFGWGDVVEAVREMVPHE